MQRVQTFAQTGKGSKKPTSPPLKKPTSCQPKNPQDINPRSNQLKTERHPHQRSEPLQRGHWVDFQPVSSVSDGGPITFHSPGTKDYVDLSKTILVVQAEGTKADGTDLDADQKVGIVNNLLHSLFKQVDVFLKEKTSDTSNRNVCVSCLFGNPPQLQSCSQEISINGIVVLQR